MNGRQKKMPLTKLSGNDIVSTWEEGEGKKAWFKGVKILSYALPHLVEKEVQALSIGQRNTYLLELRQHMSGPIIDTFTVCPGCANQIGFNLNINDIFADGGTCAGDGAAVMEGQSNVPGQRQSASALEFSLTLEGVTICFRLPNSLDLAAAGENLDAPSLRRVLLERAIIHTAKKRKKLDVKELPTSIFNDLAEKMNEIYDPLFEMRLALDCPFCGHQWSVLFDILSFFWAELRKQARELLRDVHILAAAYGWNEKDILEMSAARRDYYLDCQTTAGNRQSTANRQQAAGKQGTGKWQRVTA